MQIEKQPDMFSKSYDASKYRLRRGSGLEIRLVNVELDWYSYKGGLDQGSLPDEWGDWVVDKHAGKIIHISKRTYQPSFGEKLKSSFFEYLKDPGLVLARVKPFTR